MDGCIIENRNYCILYKEKKELNKKTRVAVGIGYYHEVRTPFKSLAGTQYMVDGTKKVGT